MPAPDVRGGAWEAVDQPHTPSEIMGRGPGARKSKSFFSSGREATLLALIDAYPDMLLKLFREQHARFHTTLVRVELEDGVVEEREVPEVLTDDELREEYPYIAVWERMHQEQVEHRPSIEGFSIQSAVGAREEDRRAKQEESSAGSEKRNGERRSEPSGGWR